MRNVWVAALVLIFGLVPSAHGKWPEVDLDQPGAMETLEREYPERHKRILAEIERAQTIHVDAVPTTQNLGTRLDDPRLRGAGSVLPSHPAKLRLTTLIDGVVYRMTAHLTKTPARLEKAE